VKKPLSDQKGSKSDHNIDSCKYPDPELWFFKRTVTVTLTVLHCWLRPSNTLNSNFLWHPTTPHRAHVLQHSPTPLSLPVTADEPLLLMTTTYTVLNCAVYTLKLPAIHLYLMPTTASCTPVHRWALNLISVISDIGLSLISEPPISE
jgi:hypothetical protein